MKTTVRFFYSILILAIVFTSCENEVNDTQPANVVDLKLINTKPLQNLSLNSGISGGIITNTNGIEILTRGICWGTNPKPTIDLATKTTYNGLSDNYTASIFGLKENTTYYVRAFVTNSKGAIYGNDIVFNTAPSNNLYTDGAGVTDIDNNNYKTIIINTPALVDKTITIIKKEWMAENLRTTKFRNGDEITTGIWKHDEPKYDKIYGKYYNWVTVSDAKKICPEGWHVTTRSEWTDLRTLLDTTGIVKNKSGVKMRAIGLIKNSNGLWEDSMDSPEGTNESGLNAIPSGTYDFYKKDFSLEIGKTALFWSGTVKRDQLTAYTTNVSHYTDKATEQFSDQKQSGLSCRCVKD